MLKVLTYFMFRWPKNGIAAPPCPSSVVSPNLAIRSRFFHVGSTGGWVQIEGRLWHTHMGLGGQHCTHYNTWKISNHGQLSTQLTIRFLVRFWFWFLHKVRPRKYVYFFHYGSYSKNVCKISGSLFICLFVKIMNHTISK